VNIVSNRLAELQIASLLTIKIRPKKITFFGGRLFWGEKGIREIERSEKNFVITNNRSLYYTLNI